MKIEKSNLEHARSLLNELETLESALDVTKNYDCEISIQFHTMHNHNKPEPKKVTISIGRFSFMEDSARKFILNELNPRIEKIKKELETM